MTRRVGRLSRAIDIASLTLILAGGGLFLRAYNGMVEIRDAPETPFVRGTVEAYELTNRYMGYKRLSYFGLALVGAGVAVGLSAAMHAYKIGRRQADGSPLPE